MPDPVVQMSGVTKRFTGATALDDVDFRLLPGEIHALIGENGAGKSTLIKVLTGVHSADAGHITLHGEPVAFHSPQQAQRAGISTVYQEVNLVDNLSVAENIYIGREPRRLGLINFGRMRRDARELVARIGLDINVAAPLSAYSLAIQQLVAIVRAVDIEAKALILDEPTSSLDREEVERLFTVMRALAADGVAILFVSHFLDQIYEVSDRMTILRNGRLVAEFAVGQLTEAELIGHMIGRDMATLRDIEEHPPRAAATGNGAAPLVQAVALTKKGSIAPFHLQVRAGEVLGLAGLLGSGRTEVARLLAGADRADAGALTIDGQRAVLRSPRHAIARSIAFCPENRRTEGLIAQLSVADNIMLALQAARGWARRVPLSRRAELVARFIEKLNIRPADPDIPVANLSGGNQQKVLLARWMIIQPRLLILDEPTRGIDVGAKAEIQKLVTELSDGGMAVVFISAELDEVMRLSDHIAVLRDRRLIEVLVNDDTVTTDHIVDTIAAAGARS